MPADEEKRIREIFIAIVKDKKFIKKLENINIHKNGKFLTLETNGVPIFNDTGDLIGYRGIDRDITDRKQLENFLKKSEQDLRIRNKLSNIFLTISDDKEMFRKTLDIILDASKSEIGLFGYIDQNEALVFPAMHQDVWDKCQMIDKTFIFPKETWGGIWEKTLLTKKILCSNKIHSVPKGHIPIYRTISVPIMHQESVIGLIEVANKSTDYNEEDKMLLESIANHIAPILYAKLQRDKQKEINKKAEQKKVELERSLIQAQKMESIGTLAAGIAHEINTPIQFIANNTNFILESNIQLLDLIKAYKDILHTWEPGEKTSIAISKAEELEENFALPFLKEEIPSALKDTKEGVNRVAEIVKAMKDFSHMGSDTKEVADINKAIESTITISRNEWKYVAEIKTDLSPLLVECFIGDIKQVLLNLIVNATHAIKDVISESKEEKGLITISTRQENNYFVISVSDTGTGIPEDIRHKIFDPFFTTKQIGKGTGQGLSLAYSSIVTKHSGELTFDTVMGKGTTFFIKLPI